MAHDWYFLDPDNNREDPKTGLFCIRCKRKVKETQAVTSFISVDLHPNPIEFPWVRKSITGKHLIGEDCWKSITKDGPIEEILRREAKHDENDSQLNK